MPVLPVETQRQRFLRLAKSKLGCLYRWHTKGPERFDCSGLVTWALHEAGGPDLRASWWTQRMFDELPEVSADEAKPGDVCLYGRTPLTISHVTILCEDGRVLGANGGDSSTTSDERAQQQGACVSYRSGPKYQNTFRGFRRLPFTDEE